MKGLEEIAIDRQELLEYIECLKGKHNKDICELTEKFKIKQEFFRVEIEESFKRMKHLEKQVDKLIEVISAITQKINKGW